MTQDNKGTNDNTKMGLWEVVDAFLFRIIGAMIGMAGCAGLLTNNPLEELFTSSYGLVFLVMFAVLAIYSLLTMARDTVSLLNS